MIWRKLRPVVLTFFVFSAPLPVLAQATTPSIDELRSAAQTADPLAQFALGQRYHSGDGVLQNYSQAAEWFEAAAAQGYAPAQHFLGMYLFEGLAGQKDQTRAMTLLMQAAQSGDPQYQYDAALALQQNEETLSQAVTLYEAAASSGHVEASVSLGALYQNGTGVTQDFAKAQALYLPAAEKGHPRALNNLGLLYVRGDGVAQNYAQAVQLFSAAAEQGLPRALRNLGVMYENGYGVPVDEAKAAELYRQAGRGGDSGAQPDARPATFVYDPRLAPIDPNNIDTTRLIAAAKAGDPIALFQLGWLQVSGPAETIEFGAYRSAAQAFSLAAEKGHSPSMVNLGIMYFEGWGLPQDYVLGQQWFILASVGLPEAKQIQVRFSARASAGQISEAQTRAGNWIAGQALQPTIE